MSKVLTISIPEWLYNEIEERRTLKENTNRSEYVTELIIKGIGIQGGNN